MNPTILPQFGQAAKVNKRVIKAFTKSIDKQATNDNLGQQSEVGFNGR